MPLVSGSQIRCCMCNNYTFITDGEPLPSSWLLVNIPPSGDKGMRAITECLCALCTIHTKHAIEELHKQPSAADDVDTRTRADIELNDRGFPTLDRR